MRSTCCKNEMPPAGRAASQATSTAWLRLGGCTAAILVIWLVVLPWIAADPAVQRRVRFLEQRRIDPSAMFYTELEVMDDIRARMQAIQRQQAGTFWRSAMARQHPHDGTNSPSPREGSNIRAQRPGWIVPDLVVELAARE